MKTSSHNSEELLTNTLFAGCGELAKGVEYYKRATSLIARTNKVLGRTKDYKQISVSTLDLKISSHGFGSTTNF